MLACCRVAVITHLLAVAAFTKLPILLSMMDASERANKAAMPVKALRRVSEWGKQGAS